MGGGGTSIFMMYFVAWVMNDVLHRSEVRRLICTVSKALKCGCTKDYSNHPVVPFLSSNSFQNSSTLAGISYIHLPFTCLAFLLQSSYITKLTLFLSENIAVFIGHIFFITKEG